MFFFPIFSRQILAISFLYLPQHTPFFLVIRPFDRPRSTFSSYPFLPLSRRIASSPGHYGVFKFWITNCLSKHQSYFLINFGSDNIRACSFTNCGVSHLLKCSLYFNLIVKTPLISLILLQSQPCLNILSCSGREKLKRTNS